MFREVFETPCEVFFVFTGTAGNSLALASLCRSYQSIICHQYSHLETDDCGAPEFLSHGVKLLLASGAEGKLEPDRVEMLVTKRSDIHYPRPRVMSMSEPTELGTVYIPEELDALRQVALRHKLSMHMDGARFANAVASLDIAPKDLTAKRGIDVLVFGGCKNGLPGSEAEQRLRQYVVDALHEKGWDFYPFIGTGGARLLRSP